MHGFIQDSRFIKMLEFFFFVLYTYLFACIFLDEACQKYQNLTDGTRKYDHITVQSKCDDTLIFGWYRFQGAAGTKVATTCPPVNRCDTSSPVWLNGKHPSVAEGTVQRNFCIHQIGNCCHSSFKVYVKNCSSYYMYKLFYPGVCNTRYCSTD